MNNSTINLKPKANIQQGPSMKPWEQGFNYTPSNDLPELRETIDAGEARTMDIDFHYLGVLSAAQWHTKENPATDTQPMGPAPEQGPANPKMYGCNHDRARGEWSVAEVMEYIKNNN